MEYKIDDGVISRKTVLIMMESHPPFSSSQRLLSCIVKGIRDPSAEGDIGHKSHLFILYMKALSTGRHLVIE